MSEVFDEKVVAMKFDNKDFEKNAAQSMSTLQKLKAALNFKDSAKELNELTQASKKVDFSNITNGIGEAIKNFDLLDMIGIKVLSRIADKVIDTGKRIASSLTIDPIKTGVGVYEQKINSVQTMLNNSGKDLATVNRVLDDLNEYSDKTIFSLNDMTTALGKFTAQGVDLEKAATIIKGAANEAATMGAGSAEFSRFIYNLTQAYGMGKMTTIDWKSLENAGVAGKKFKEQLIESYETMAKLGKVTDKFVGKLNASNLREYLKDGIITADVMTDTFEKYAGTKEGFEAFGKAAQNAAQEIKTFHQLLDVLSESVASSWSQSFGYIIGDFYEAKNLWTNISKLFDATFGKINERRNDLLKEWKEGFVDWSRISQAEIEAVGGIDAAMNNSDFLNEHKISGRTMLLDAFCNVLLALHRIITPIKDAFREFFPASTAQNLWEATKNLRDFTAHLRLSDTAVRDLKNVARGFFAIIKTGRDIIKDILGALIPATKNTNSLLAIILHLAGALGDFIARVVPAIRESATWQVILKGIATALSTIVKIIAILIVLIYRLVKAANDFGLLQKIFRLVAGAIGLVITGVKNIIPATKSAFDYIRNYSGGVIGFIMDGVSKIAEFVSKIFSRNGIKDGKKQVDGIADSVGTLTEKVEELKKDKYGNPIFSEDYKKAHTIDIEAANASKISNETEKTAQAAQKSGTLIQRFGAALIGIVKGLGSGIVSIVDKVKTALFGIGDEVGVVTDRVQGAHSKIGGGLSSLVDHMKKVTKNVKDSEDELGNSSEGLATKIGRIFNNLFGGLRRVNWGAVVLGALLGSILIILAKVATGISQIGKGFNNAAKSAKNITKSFENMTAVIRARKNIIVNVLKSIALGILAITASLWLLSSLQDEGKLEAALGALIAALLSVITLFTIAALITKKAGIAGPLKQLGIALLAASAFFLAMAISFSSVVDTLKRINGDWGIIVQAGVVFAGMAALLIGMSYFFGKMNVKEGIKSVISIIAFALALKSVVKSLKGLYKEAKDLSGEQIIAIWSGGILPVLTLLAGLTVAAVFIKGKGGIGSFIFLMGIVWACKSLINVIKELALNGVGDKIEQHKLIFAALLAAFVVLGIFIAKYGNKFLQFASGILMIGATIVAIGMLAATLERLDIGPKALIVPTLIAGLVIGMAAVLALIFKNKDFSKNLISFSAIIASIALIIVAIGKAMSGILSATNGRNSDVAVGIVAVMVVGISLIIASLALLASQLKKIKNVKLGGFIGIMVALTVMILAIGGLAKTFDKVSITSMIGAIAAVGVVVGMLAALARRMGGFKHVKTSVLLSFVLVLLVIFTNLIILTTYDWYELIAPVIAMSAVMAALAVVVYNMKNLKDVDFKNIVALAVTIAIITGSLIFMNSLNIPELIASAIALAGVLIALGVCVRLMNDFEHINPVTIASFALVIAVIAGSLIFMNDLHFGRLMGSVLAIAACLAALVGAIKLLDGSEKHVAATIALSASILVIAGALYILNDLDFGMLMGSCLAIAVCLGVLVAAIKLADGSAKNVAMAVVFSVAIGVIAAALMGVCYVVGDNIALLLAAAGGIAAVLLIMAVAIKIASKANGDVAKVLAAASTFVIVAVALGIMSIAINNLKDVPLERIGIAIGMVTAIALIVGLLSKLGGSASRLLAAAGAIAIVSASLLIIGLSIKQLEGIKWEDMLTAAGTIVVLAVAILIASTMGLKALAGAGAIAIACVSMIILAEACKKLNEIDAGRLNSIVDSLSQIVVVMSIMALIGGVMGTNALLGASAMVVVALGLVVFSEACKKLDEIDSKKLSDMINSLSQIIVLMSVMSLIGGLLGTAAIMGATAFVVMSAGILVLAYALKQMEEVGDIAKIAESINKLINPLGALALLGIIMTVGAPGVLLMGAALNVLGPGLEAIDKAKSSFGRIAELAGGLAVMGVAGIIMSAGGTGLIIGGLGIMSMAMGLQQLSKVDRSLDGGWMASIGAGLLVISIAGVILDVGAAGLLIGGPALMLIAEGLMSMSKCVGVIDGGYLAGIGGGLISLGIGGIIASVGMTGLLLVALPLVEIADALAALARCGVEDPGKMLRSIASGIRAFGGNGLLAGIGSGGLDAIAGPIVDISYALAYLSKSEIDFKKVDQVADSVGKIAAMGVAGLGSGMGLVMLGTGLKVLCTGLESYISLIERLNELTTVTLAADAAEMGKNITEGCKLGIQSGLPAVAAEAIGMAGMVVKGICETLEIHSPSLILLGLGVMAVAGFIMGIDSGKDDAAKAAEEVANAAIDRFTERIGEFTDTIKSQFSGLLGEETVEIEYYYDMGAMRTREVKKTKGGLMEMIKDFMTGDGTSFSIDDLWSKITENSDWLKDPTSLFQGMFDGFDDLKDIFSDLSDVTGELDLDISGLDTNFDGLAAAVDATDKKTGSLNSTMNKSIATMKEFDRSTSKTLKDIEKTMLSHILSEDEFQAMTANLVHFGFSEDVVKDVANQYKNSGLTEELYSYVAALNEYGIMSEEAVKNFNESFAKFKYSQGGGTLQAEYLLDEASDIKWGYRDLSKVVATTKQITGENTEAIVGKAAEGSNAWRQIVGTAKIVSKETAQEYEQLMSEEEKRQAYLDKQEELEGSNRAKVADRMIQDFTDAVKDALSKYFLPSYFEDIGINLCVGLVNGINLKYYDTIDAAEKFARAVVQAMRDGTEEQSPSKATMQIGEYLDEGLAIGLEHNGEAVEAAEKYSTNLLDELRYQLARIMSLTDEEWSPVITPVFDMTGASAEMQRFNNGLSSTITTAANADFGYYRAQQMLQQASLAGMSKEEIQGFLTAFANDVVNAINSDGPVPVDVNVTLEGDAKGLFNVVRDQNEEYKKTAGGRSAFV